MPELCYLTSDTQVVEDIAARPTTTTTGTPPGFTPFQVSPSPAHLQETITDGPAPAGWTISQLQYKLHLCNLLSIWRQSCFLCNFLLPQEMLGNNRWVIFIVHLLNERPSEPAVWYSDNSDCSRTFFVRKQEFMDSLLLLFDCVDLSYCCNKPYTAN